jgi:hypothetical protein
MTGVDAAAVIVVLRRHEQQGGVCSWNSASPMYALESLQSNVDGAMMAGSQRSHAWARR